MGAVLKLDFEGRRLHAFRRGGLTYFVLTDLCAILDVGNPADVASRLDDDQKGIDTIDTLGGRQRMLIVSEDAAYELACTSRKPIAQRFKRWLYREVLPEIRRTGSYRGGSGPLDDLISSFQPELPLPRVEQPKPKLRVVPPPEPEEEREWDIQDYMDADAPMPAPTRREIFQEIYAGVDYAVTVTHRGYPWDIRIMRADSNWCRKPQSVYLPTDPVVLVTWDWARTPRGAIYGILDRLGVNSDLVRETLDSNIFDAKRKKPPTPQVK